MIIQMSAQTVTLNKRFGKVSKEELEMTEYKPDSAAVAVVLYENRNIQVDLSAGGAFVKDVDVHMRIKILKEEGTEWGDFSVMKYVSQSVPEIVTGIEVVTYNLENDKVVPTKMSREFIYTEDVSSSFQKISFYAQDVKVGSVIEMKYSIHSDRFWEIDDVYFQKTIPVNWVESQVSIPGFFTFNKKLHGSLPVQYDSKLEPKNLFGYQYEMVVDKFVAVELPAFKYEPYIYYPRQYFSFVTYDIRTRRPNVEEVMETVDIGKVSGRLIKNLSKGYKQRVGLAQALIGSPEVLVLDEPTVGLDPGQIIEIRSVIKKLGEKRTIILSTHILQEVAAICDRVIIINNGKIAAMDTLENLSGSGKGEYLIRVRSSFSKIKDIFAGMGRIENMGHVESNSVDVKITTDTDKRADIIKTLASNGVDVLMLRPVEHTLEEVFIKATGSAETEASE